MGYSDRQHATFAGDMARYLSGYWRWPCASFLERRNLLTVPELARWNDAAQLVWSEYSLHLRALATGSARARHYARQVAAANDAYRVAETTLCRSHGAACPVN